MCGRYATTRSTADLSAEFEVERTDDTPEVQASYNVAPTQAVPAVISRTPRGEDGPPRRQLRLLTWGLVPSWAKDARIGNKMINARLETAADKPSFRKAFAVRRALIPADGYYEWYATDRRNAKGKPVKQPFFIRPRDGGVLAMAGLYEIWRDQQAEGDDAWLWTCTILTTSAEDSLGHIHDRMPLLVERDQYATWLDPALDDAGRAADVLVPAAPGRLEAYPVSTDVNNVRNDEPGLIEPAAAEAEDDGLWARDA